MRARCEWEIINDMLLVLRDRELPTPLRLVYEGAKVGSSIQEKYYDILKNCGLAKMTEHKEGACIVFKASITPKGIQFLIFFEALEKLLRSGFNDKKKNTSRSIII